MPSSIPDLSVAAAAALSENNTTSTDTPQTPGLSGPSFTLVFHSDGSGTSTSAPAQKSTQKFALLGNNIPRRSASCQSISL